VNATGDGCISSTPEDMTAYLRMLMNRGRGRHGRILSEDSFALLTQHAAERDDRWYGYGVQTWESDGRRHVGHGGGMVGFFSDMRADLDTGVGAIVLVNAPDFEVTEEIAGDALASLRAAVQGDALPDVRPSGDRLRVPHADQLTGTYRGAERELVVQTEGDHVWIQDGEDRAELEPLERDQFVPRHDRLDRFRVRFHRDGGDVVSVTHGPRRWSARGDRPGAGAPAEYCGHYRSFNPWAPDIRVFERGGELFLVTYPMGTEDRLVPVESGGFLAGDHPAPHRVRFDATARGKALRATISGAPHYRTSL
jgi:hypothetical protein